MCSGCGLKKTKKKKKKISIKNSNASLGNKYQHTVYLYYGFYIAILTPQNYASYLSFGGLTRRGRKLGPIISPTPCPKYSKDLKELKAQRSARNNWEGEKKNKKNPLHGNVSLVKKITGKETQRILLFRA